MDNTFAPNTGLSPFAPTSTSFSRAIALPFEDNEFSNSSPSSQMLGNDLALPFSTPSIREEQAHQRDPFITSMSLHDVSGDRKQIGGKDSLTGVSPAVAAVMEETASLQKLAQPSTRLSAIDKGVSNPREIKINLNFFSKFNVVDASRDNTTQTVFEDGALRLNYQWLNAMNLSQVRLEAIQGGSVVANLGTWSSSKLSNKIINLANFSSIEEGVYKIRATAQTTGGSIYSSVATTIEVLPWTVKYGTVAPDTLNYFGAAQTGEVFLGRGGTDTLNLSGLAKADVTSINGMSLSSFSPLFNSTSSQAIFQGSAFDYLTLSNGREIYFQGIEALKFSDGSMELQVHPNDTYFNEQWNLRVSDVESAWRFTRGSSGILLASLDTGILTAVGGTGGISDISSSRLVTDPTDDDNFNDYGHGHNAMSVMGSTAYNGSGVTGINWYSKMYVNDVYGGVSLQTAIKDTINYAKANNMKVVFQGGIQGEGWLNSGGTQAQLEALISNNSDIALFAVAAGNGGPGGNLNDPNYLNSVSGVAKLQTTHSNVMSVGALAHTGVTYVDGLANASSVDITSYSNRGSNLTLMAATNSPAMDKNGNMNYFTGTSCANPNMAAIASLVWSVNPYFSGGQVRQLLIDTAMDLGTFGKDNTFGHGLVNADAAVRRAWALKEDYQLASLCSSKRWQPGLFIDFSNIVLKDIKFTVDSKFTPSLPSNVEGASLPGVESGFDQGLASVATSLSTDGVGDRPDSSLERHLSLFDELIVPGRNFLNDMVKEHSWGEAIAEEFSLV